MSACVRACVFVAITLSLTIPASLYAGGEMACDSSRVGKGDIIIPFSNPLSDFDSNSIAWWTVNNLLMNGEGYIDDRLNLKSSMLGRSVNIALYLYIVLATSCYSHEIAHDFIPTKHNNQNFTVNWHDWWSSLFPKYIQSRWEDCWDYDDVVPSTLDSPNVRINKYKRYILEIESGLYQQRFNSIIVAHDMSLNRGITPEISITFIPNQIEDLLYILGHGRDRIHYYHGKHGIYWTVDCNDINGYIVKMEEGLDIHISLDGWLLASAFADLLSAHTINSIHALARYLLYGDEKVYPLLRLRLGEKTNVGLPNFYLFPSTGGLFLETESFIDFGNKGCFLCLGSGLDALGAHGTGKVDRLRIGGQYHSIDLNLRYLNLRLSPFLYLDFTNRLSHMGESIGIEANLSRLGRLSLYGKLEYNRDDMIEQIIKYKDNGFYFISGLVIKM